jgi:sortase A
MDLKPVMKSVQRLFLWFGVIVLIYAGGTALYAGVYQRYQSWKFVSAFTASDYNRIVVSNRGVDLREGDVVGRLAIPEVGISVMVFQGTEEDTLRGGAGHVPGTPLPGAGGNVAIAAHRDTYFRKLEGVRVGDKIEVATLRQTFDYVVESTEIVDPQDTRVIESRDHPELTLITCFPFYFVGSAPRRFIVHARPIPADRYRIRDLGG